MSRPSRHAALQRGWWRAGASSRWSARRSPSLVDAGFDAVMFCNEHDRPYALKADLVASAVMARVVTECRPKRSPSASTTSGTPSALSPRPWRPRPSSCARWPRALGSPTWATGRPDAAALLRQRRHLDAERLAIFMNVTPEFASTTGQRSPVEVAISVAVSSMPDAILISGPMAGTEPSVSIVAEVRKAVPSRYAGAPEHRRAARQHRRVP